MDNFKAVTHSFLAGGDFSDFTIVCQGKEYKVHQIIISAHSKWFQRCCLGGFKENELKRVELKEDIPLIVERMVQFFYKFDYDEDVPNEATDSIRTPAELHAFMYATGDKYDAPDLKATALSKFRQSVAVVTQPSPDRLIGLARTVYGVLQLPESDYALRKVLVEAFVFSGTDVLSQYRSSGQLAILAAEIPLFFAELADCFLGGMAKDFYYRCSTGQHLLCQSFPAVGRELWCPDCCKYQKAIEDAMVKSEVKMKKLW